MNRARSALVVAVVLALVAVGPVAATAGPPRTTDATTSGPPGGGSGTATVNDASVPAAGGDRRSGSADEAVIGATGAASATVGENDSTANESAGDPTSNETPDGPFGENESATSTGEISEKIDREPVYEPSYSIPFRSETVTPEPGFDPAIEDTDREFVWVLVQFHEPQPPDATQRLREEYGYQEGYGVTDTAVYAGVPRDNAAELADDPAVRSVTAIRPEWRLEPLVVEAIERGEDAEGVRDDGIPGGVWVTVVAFESLEYDWLESSEELTYTGTLTPERAERIATDERVAYVERRFPMTAQTAEGRTLVGADLVQRNGGLTGQGVTVGILDSGLTRRHDHFQNVGLTAATNDAWGDNCDHGTHVAGTIAGNDTSSARAGVAPDADLVIAKYLKLRNDGDCTGRKAPRRIYGRVRNRGARIISNSWGNDGKGRYGWVARVTDKWVRNHRDTLLVFANGNNDLNQRQWMHSPGLSKNVLTVGAVHDGTTNAGTTTPNSIRLAERDSSLNDLVGPRDVDPQGGGSYSGSGRVHPAVYAPGENVSAPEAGTQNDYTSKDGTSMATPYVSGAAALYRQTHPGASANRMRAAIVATTTDGPGYGVVNANDLVKNNRYELAQQYYESSIGKGDTHDSNFRMPEGVEELTVVLSWIDPPRKAWLKPSKDKGFLSNDLELFAGPSGDVRRHRVTHEGNIKKLVVEDPEPGPYTIRIHGRRVTAWTSQKYGFVLRAVTDEPTVDVQANGGTVPAGATGGIPIRIQGTGAPVSAARVELSADKDLQLCGQQTILVGDVSKGYGRNVTACLSALSPGTHDLTVRVASPSLDSPVEENVTFHVPENQPPETVKNVRTPSHSKTLSSGADQWTSQQQMKIEWDRAADNGPAGTGGYYVELSEARNPTTPMNGTLATVNATGAGNTSATVTVPDSGWWYVHVRAYDAEGNVGDANTSGPYQIDVEPPRVTAVGHHPNSYSLGGTEGNVTFGWSGRDRHSGVENYLTRLECVTAPSGQQCRDRAPVPRKEYEEPSFQLGPGKYNFTVQALDAVGNPSPKVTDTYYVDRQPPTAKIAGDRYRTKAYDIVTFDAGPSHDDVEIVEYRWAFGNGETANTTTPTVDYEYEVMQRAKTTVTVVDGAGQTDTDTVNVTVAPGLPGRSKDPEEYDLNYAGPRPGEWLDERPPKTREEIEQAVELAGIGIRPEEPHEDLGLGVTAGPEPTETVPTVPEAAIPVSDFVAVDAPETFVGDARVRFRVSKEALARLEASPDDLAVLHAKAGAETWDRPETGVVGEDEEHYDVQAESEGFSTFVLAIDDGETAVEQEDKDDPTPDEEEETEEPTTTSAPTTDEGTADPTPTPTEDETTADEATGESTQAQTESGEETVPTEGSEADEPPATTETEDPAASTQSPDPGDDGEDGIDLPQPGFGPAITLVAVLLGLLAIRRRA